MKAATLLVLLCACGSDSPRTLPTGTDIAEFIDVAVVGAEATVTHEDGDAPAAGTGPGVTLVAGDTAINGGSLFVTVDGASSFDRVVVALDGAQGHFVVTFPEGQASAELVVTLAQGISQSHLDLVVAAADGEALGAYATHATVVHPVGTGDVQVSVSWDVDSDVDLHVVDPHGDEVFFANKTVPSGGTLDLDSNSGCDLDHVKNENITWATAPAGMYTVLVEYSDSCGVDATSYVVTVQVRGAEPQTFTGRLTGLGDGAIGTGSEVATFEVR